MIDLTKLVEIYEQNKAVFSEKLSQEIIESFYSNLSENGKWFSQLVQNTGKVICDKMQGTGLSDLTDADGVVRATFEYSNDPGEGVIKCSNSSLDRFVFDGKSVSRYFTICQATVELWKGNEKKLCSVTVPIDCSTPIRTITFDDETARQIQNHLDIISLKVGFQIKNEVADFALGLFANGVYRYIIEQGMPNPERVGSVKEDDGIFSQVFREYKIPTYDLEKLDKYEDVLKDALSEIRGEIESQIADFVDENFIEHEVERYLSVIMRTSEHWTESLYIRNCLFDYDYGLAAIHNSRDMTICIQNVEVVVVPTLNGITVSYLPFTIHLLDLSKKCRMDKKIFINVDRDDMAFLISRLDKIRFKSYVMSSSFFEGIADLMEGRLKKFGLEVESIQAMPTPEMGVNFTIANPGIRRN